jgi:hypothetical protein
MRHARRAGVSGAAKDNEVAFHHGSGIVARITDTLNKLPVIAGHAGGERTGKERLPIQTKRR